MAAIVRVKGFLATFDRQEGMWTSEEMYIAKQLNREMTLRIPSYSYVAEQLDYEGTVARYIVERLGGEIVHVDPYLDEDDDPNAIY